MQCPRHFTLKCSKQFMLKLCLQHLGPVAHSSVQSNCLSVNRRRSLRCAFCQGVCVMQFAKECALCGLSRSVLCAVCQGVCVVRYVKECALCGMSSMHGAVRQGFSLVYEGGGVITMNVTAASATLGCDSLIVFHKFPSFPTQLCTYLGLARTVYIHRI